MLRPPQRKEPNKPTRTKTRRASPQLDALDLNPINNANDYDYEDWMDGCGPSVEAPQGSN